MTHARQYPLPISLEVAVNQLTEEYGPGKITVVLPNGLGWPLKQFLKIFGHGDYVGTGYVATGFIVSEPKKKKRYYTITVKRMDQLEERNTIWL